MTPFTMDSPLGCVSCGASFPELLFKKAYGEHNIELLKCRICSMVFLKPMHTTEPTPLYDYYAQRMHLNKDELYSQVTEISFTKLLALFKKSCTAGNRILDVGCGDGHFIDVCLRQGWDAQGIDTSQSAVELCRKFNLPVRQLDFFSSELKPGSFNVVTLFEVLEHVHGAGRFFSRAEELLAPGGILYITTPNYASIDSRILRSRWSVIDYGHFNYFTPLTLKKTLALYSRLSVISLKTRNISLEIFFRLTKNKKRNCPVPEKPYYNVNNPCVNQEQNLRRLALKIPILGFTKNAVNTLLNLCEGGSTITMLAKKPSHY